VFKQSWHEGDVEPGAILNYSQSTLMIACMDRFIMAKALNAGPFELCKFMQMASHFQEERRIVDDAFKAYAAIALFFDADAFLADPIGSPYRNTKLLNQEERAKTVPDRRTHKSSKTLPSEFWKGWEKLVKDNKRKINDPNEDIYPIDWRKAIRPVVVRRKCSSASTWHSTSIHRLTPLTVLRAGVICPSYGHAAGIATAASESDRGMDLYIDYRHVVPIARPAPHLTDPTPLDRDFVIKRVKSFTQSNSAAKFAVLRLWSAPHFYPIILGLDKRQMCTFLDDRGRCWEFKFVPKDMPYSEWSIHQHLLLRLEPCKEMFGQQVIVAKDLVLVMGRDARNLRQLAEGVTWAIQTKPWRLEVDWWRSFVNVEAEFLEGLDRRWLD